MDLQTTNSTGAQGDLAAAGADIQSTAQVTSNDVDSSDAALINRFASDVEVPQWCRDKFRQMVADRDYIRRDCMMTDTQDTVAVNHILRNQMLTLGYMGISDPQPFCQPAKRVGGQVSQIVELFANTMEIHLSQQAAQMRFAEKIEGACQDGSTNSYSVLKVTLQSDFLKDSTGEARFGDMQESVAEYIRLKECIANGTLTEGQAEYSQYRDLEDTLRVFAAGKLEEQIKSVPQMVPGMVPSMNPMTGEPLVDPATLQPVMAPGMVSDPQDPRELQRLAMLGGKEFDILGLPVIPHFMGFTCDQVMPEDFRWDWRITRPEDIQNSEWMAHRVFMRADEISRKWGIDKKEIAAGSSSMSSTGRASTARDTSLDPSQRIAPEINSINDEIAVWELYHKPTLHRYVFIPGVKRFLEKEVFQACGHRFYPFFMLAFNRVTGQIIPPSDVQLARKLQDEVNTLRSHDREARRSAYPVLFAQRGWLDGKSMEMYRNRYPFSIIEVNNADEVKKQYSESSVIQYDPRLYDTNKAVGDMAEMFGLPRTVSGASSGEDLASAMALAKEGMETGVQRRRIQVNRVITDIFAWMAEISLKVFPESVIKKSCGDAAVWPRMTTEELYTNIRIEVQGGLSGQPRSKDRLDLWTNFANIASSLGLPVNGPEVLKELLEAVGIRTDFTRFLAPVPMPGMAMGPGGPLPPQASQQQPKPKKGQGPDGGAPPMVERGAPDNLAQIPNHPKSIPNSKDS